MDEKWIRDTAEQVRRRIEAKKVKDAKFVETQRLKQELGPGAWADLKDAVRDACAAINKEMGAEVIKYSEVDGGHIVVQGVGDGMYRRMTMKFSAEKAQLTYESDQGNPMGKFDVAIDGNAKARFGSCDYPDGRSVDEVTREIVRHALELSALY